MKVSHDSFQLLLDLHHTLTVPTFVGIVIDSGYPDEKYGSKNSLSSTGKISSDGYFNFTVI